MPVMTPFLSVIDLCSTDVRPLSYAIPNRELVGSIFLANTVRPDITFEVKYLSRFMNQLGNRSVRPAGFCYGIWVRQLQCASLINMIILHQDLLCTPTSSKHIKRLCKHLFLVKFLCWLVDQFYVCQRSRPSWHKAQESRSAWRFALCVQNVKLMKKEYCPRKGFGGKSTLNALLNIRILKGDLACIRKATHLVMSDL